MFIANDAHLEGIAPFRSEIVTMLVSLLKELSLIHYTAWNYKHSGPNGPSADIEDD